MIAEIVATVPAGVATFLLTSRTTSPEIIRQLERCGANTLQLVDRIAPEARRRLRTALPSVSIVQVVHVCDESAIAEAVDVSSDADAILLDSGNPSLVVKELGGTGRAHDWEISRAIRDAVTIPVWLAGGCSGVRTAGNLDETKLTAFMNALAAV
jgi:phosphoribosylanthranilate isomerase